MLELTVMQSMVGCLNRLSPVGWYLWTNGQWLQYLRLGRFMARSVHWWRDRRHRSIRRRSEMVSHVAILEASMN